MNAFNSLPHADAMILLAIPDADRYPYRVINDHGADRIVEWLAALGWPTYKDAVSSWMADAEGQPVDEVAVLEIPARATKSGRPETLYLDADCFDWRIDESDLRPALLHHLRASGPDSLSCIVRYCREQFNEGVTAKEVLDALRGLPCVEYDAEFDAYELT